MPIDQESKSTNQDARTASTFALVARRTSDDRWDGWISAVLVVYAIGITLWLLWQGVHVTEEDGYFYFKIADQMAHGAGSTFDGLHATNGYHPLWLLCLAAIFRMAPSQEAVAAAILLQGLWMAGCGVLIYRTARLALRPSSAGLAALLWIGLTYREALSGLEFGLHALLLLGAAYLYLSRFDKATRPAWGSYGILGTLLSLTFLARVESLALAIILGLFLVLRECREGWIVESFRRLGAFGLPVAFTFLIYIVLNLSLFGHPMPVSAAVKWQWSAALLAHDPSFRAHGWLVAKAVLLCWPLRDLRNYASVAFGVFVAPMVLGVALASPQRPVLNRRLASGLWPFVLYSIWQFVSTVLAYHGDLCEKPWYYVIQPWLTALLAGVLLDQLSAFRAGDKQPSRRAVAAFLSIAILAIGCVVPVRTIQALRQWASRAHSGSDHAELREAAFWIRANLPKDAVIGTWNAGTIGFLSGRRVVNLDGLENSWAYEEREHRDLCGYFQKTGITYLVDAFENGKVLTRAEGFADYASCAGHWRRIWSDGHSERSWHMEAYQRLNTDR